MGAANFMVTIRYPDHLYPSAYFFQEEDLAKRYFDSAKDLHDDDPEEWKPCIQLWTLNAAKATLEMTESN